MLDRPDQRRRESGRNLARHLEGCDACRAEFARVQLLAEEMSAWTDLPVGDHQRRACVDRLMAEKPKARPASSGWLLAPRWQLAMVAALIALVMVVAPVGRGIPGISAEIGHAFSSIEQWKAEGTATPPLLKGPDTGVCNHVEVWFAHPDRLHVRVDDGLAGPVYCLTRAGDEATSHDPFGLVDAGLETEATGLDIEALFSVQDWLASKSVLDAPVRDLGLEQFGPRTVRRIEILPRRGWLAQGQAPAPILLRVDSETMLPVLLETTVRGSVVVLDFQYGVGFPEDVSLVGLGTQLGDEGHRRESVTQ
jgi:hypothetical protein